MSNRSFEREILPGAIQSSGEREYWINKLSGDLAVSCFPQDYYKTDGDADKDRGSEIKTGNEGFRLEGELFSRLIKISGNSDSRLFILLVMGLVLLLHKYTGHEDIIVGAPIDKQAAEGEFINTILALRTTLVPGMTIKELLFQVRQTIVEACENQNYPLETIPYELNMPMSDRDHFPLFDLAIVLKNIHDKSYIDHLRPNMVFSFLLTDEYLAGEVEYNLFLYDKESIRGIIGHFIQLFQKVFDNVGARAAHLEILSESEKERLLIKINNTKGEFPEGRTIPELFEMQIEKNPGNIAVEEADTGRSLSYKELNDGANQLASLLRDKGLAGGTIAAIMGERTLELVTGILAILKTGAAYLPIDAQNPGKRIRFMLADSGAYIFLTQKHIIEQRLEIFQGFLPGNVIAIDDKKVYNGKAVNPGAGARSPDPAYIIYTSGTTGKPKGVMVRHQSLVNYINFAAANYVNDEPVNFPLYSSIGFDLTLTSLFTPLVTGNIVVVYSGWAKGNLIARMIDDNKVHAVKLTPSHLYLIRDKKKENGCCKIKRFIVGGESLDAQLAADIHRNFNGDIEIYNEYGPTEATVGCMLYKYNPQIDNRTTVSIGVPVDNTQIYLLDRNLKPVPVGAIGELYVSGTGISLGYLNRPELTAEKFLHPSPLTLTPHPSPLYKTGDLARWLRDGNIEFLGRSDQQVKIRGFRIETGEIENQLLNHDDIKKAVVIVTDAVGAGGYGGKKGDKLLCAYIVPGKGKELTTPHLREYLSAKLPDYMVPSFFVTMAHIPLTSNGKVDRGALPAPGMTAETRYTPPGSETEKKLVEIWAGLLGIAKENIGRDANFFELGGHSLSGTVLVANIHKVFDKKLLLVDIFRLPTIKQLAGHLQELENDVFESIEPVEEKEYYPLSSAQKRLYILQRMEPDNISYNISNVLEVEGEFSLERLGDVFKELIKRHENFRTSFEMGEDGAVQRIHRNVDFGIKHYDLCKGEEEEEIENIVNNFVHPFYLAQAPLLRVELIKTGNEKHILMIDMHHIISDGMSMALFVRECTAMYAGQTLPGMRFQYKDFSEWQNKKKAKEHIKQQESFWLKEFEREIPVLDLPADYPRPSLQSFAGRTLRFDIPGNDAKALRELALKEESTLYIILLSLYNILLSKLGGQEDIIVGTPILGRQHADLEDLMGMFVNTLVLRNYPYREKSFREFLKEVTKNTLNAFENQDYPFEDLVENVSVDRDVSRNPLFDVMFDLDNVELPFQEIPDVEIPGANLKPYRYESRIAQFDMTLRVIDRNEKLFFLVEYCTRLFREETIERFVSFLKKIVSLVLDDVDIKLADLEIIGAEEKKQVLYDFNNTAAGYPENKTLHRLFEEQVERKPGGTALIGREEGTTAGFTVFASYGELNHRARGLAHVLKEKGVQPDTIVGIMMERSVEMMVGIFAILKAGGAYLPIDPNYPEERIAYMLKDSGAEILLKGNDFTPGAFNICPKGTSSHLHLSPAPVTSLAYVIYTSGSTGRPKGVLVQHRSVVNRLNWMQRKYPLEPGDRILQKTSFTFDVSVWELSWWSFHGASLCLLGPGDEKVPAAIIGAIERNNVTIMHFVPSMLNAFLEYLEYLEDADGLLTLKYVFASGEALSVHHVEMFNRLLNKNKAKLINLYGPTEGTIDVSYFDCPRGEVIHRVPIGKPIDNIRLLVLNKRGGPQPIGVSGQLYIAGVGLARGYLNRPQLTAEKFVHPSPFSPHPSPLYKTGDLARWLHDGNIEFLGRVDHQIKIRGYRVELDEIKIQLLGHEKIKDAVVNAAGDESGDRYLCAYFVSQHPLAVQDLREYLAGVLPTYMIPAYFIRLERIPLSANGKIDWKSLPAPDKDALGHPMEYAAPGDALEEQLVTIWEQVLGRNSIGIKDNFFMNGGDSIKAIQIASRLNKAGYQVGVVQILQNPTISGLAPLVKRRERLAPQLSVTGKISLTPIQQWFFSHAGCVPHHYNQAVMLYWEAGFTGKAVKAIFQKLQEHHDALRMTFAKVPGKIVQINRGLPHPVSLAVYDLRGVDNAVGRLRDHANEIQAGIDLAHGPLVKLGLFHLDDGDRLLIVIHHLVIDGLSWRILFEDLETLYRQYSEGEPLSLPLKTDSYQSWSQELYKYAAGDAFREEKDYWARLEALPVPVIEKDFAVEETFMKDTHVLSFTLDEEETDLLLTRVNNAFGTEVNDILLAALGLGAWKAFECNRLLVALEGHGREEISEGIDIGRTVGWFTCIYPVILEIDHNDDLARQIKKIKEHLHQVPNNGIGYGIWKYLAGVHDERKFLPQVIFNYLGQFGTDIENMSFKIAGEPPGSTISPERRRDYELDISGIITGKRLNMSIAYSKKQYKPQTIKNLIDHFQAQLSRIISFCSSRQKRELTPADLTCKALPLEVVEELCRQYSNAVEDIYTLSPMQEGILFYVLYNKGTTAYFEQMSYRIHGKLNTAIMKESLKNLSDRYDILRTAFVYKGFKRPLQLVLKERKIDFYYEDLREKIAAGDVETFIENFKAKDRHRSFDPGKDVLMRVSVLRADREEYCFIWSFHHILIDGWCMEILVAEFYEIYRNLLQRRQPQLPAVKQYRTYIRWLEEQDKENPKNYWQDYLDNYKQAAGLPGKKKSTSAGKKYENGQIFAAPGREASNEFKHLVGTSEVTLNTIMQTAWGILLAKYNNKQDVVFGAVVSGRPPSLEGVESMVGLFINTIPVRVHYEEETTFIELIKRRQLEIIESEPHSYYPLANIQANSRLKRNLLDHIFVFQNYPVSAQLDGIMKAGNNEKPGEVPLKLSHVEAFEHSNYDLMVTLFLDKELINVRFDYNIHACDKEKLANVLKHFTGILEQVSDNPGIKVKDILTEQQLLSVESTIFLDGESDFGF